MPSRSTFQQPKHLEDQSLHAPLLLGEMQQLPAASFTQLPVCEPQRCQNSHSAVPDAAAAAAEGGSRTQRLKSIIRAVPASCKCTWSDSQNTN
jgi:hypothetical protein